ncbi:hypothetical protein J6590_051773 [Homalodisca vitripennis]|nr:hypothetical protein J6590_051773 [Homalodisca vitripennis]
MRAWKNVIVQLHLRIVRTGCWMTWSWSYGGKRHLAAVTALHGVEAASRQPGEVGGTPQRVARCAACLPRNPADPEWSASPTVATGGVGAVNSCLYSSPSRSCVYVWIFYQCGSVNDVSRLRDILTFVRELLIQFFPNTTN